VRVEELGLTTFRPMYHPVPLKLLAGRGFNIERRTPLDARHRALGAVWMPAGNWRRPEYYAVHGESREQSIEAEVEAVRTKVGLIDVSTLGKIELYGPQAGAFLDRAYAGSFANLKAGTTRYGLMLDESGVIIDDGVIARLGAERFYFTTTTGGSATVFRELTRLNALWGLDCALVNVTGHRAAFNFAGPASREILQSLTGIDLGEASFPYLAAREAWIAGVRARVLRVGFVGELGYEIHVPASSAVLVWQALYEAGRPQGLRPFGVEAQRVLRLEKGHLIVGQDTDGLTDPFEASARWAVSMKKPFFVGQRSLKILESRGPRQKLAGIEVLDATRAPKECHLVIDRGAIAGRVTSVARSRTLGKTIGLAMLAPPLAEPEARYAFAPRVARCSPRGWSLCRSTIRATCASAPGEPHERAVPGRRRYRRTPRAEGPARGRVAGGPGRYCAGTRQYLELPAGRPCTRRPARRERVLSRGAGSRRA